MKLTKQEQTDLKAVIYCGIRDQEALIDAHTDQHTGEVINADRVPVKEWKAQVERWKKLKTKLLSSNK